MSASTNRDHSSAEAGETSFYLDFATTTSGTVGTVARKKGMNTPTKNSTGTYGVTFERAYFAFLDLNLHVFGASIGSGKGFIARPVSHTVTGGKSVVVFEMLDAAGAVADVADGVSIKGSIVMKNEAFDR